MLLEKIARVGRAVKGHTRKLVFSFADIADYRKVRDNLRRAGLAWRQFSQTEMQTVAAGVAKIAAEMGVTPCTCGEPGDLSAWGVSHNRCTDPELILDITNRHPDMLRLFGIAPQQQLGLPLKLPSGKGLAAGEAAGHEYPRDSGQQAVCLCVPCRMWASTTPAPRLRILLRQYVSRCGGQNFRRHDPAGESICRAGRPRLTFPHAGCVRITPAMLAVCARPRQNICCARHSMRSRRGVSTKNSSHARPSSFARCIKYAAAAMECSLTAPLFTSES